MNIDNRPNDIGADLIRSLREGEDLAPETPREVEALLKKMKEKGIPIDICQDEAGQIAAAIISGSFSKIIAFSQPPEESVLKVELARAARLGKNAIPKETEEKMKKDREAAERKAAANDDKRKT